MMSKSSLDQPVINSYLDASECLSEMWLVSEAPMSILMLSENHLQRAVVLSMLHRMYPDYPVI